MGAWARPGRDRRRVAGGGEEVAVVLRVKRKNGEVAPRRKRNDTPLTVDDVLLGDPAEADPVLDALLDPHELDMCEFAHAVPPGLSGNSRVSRLRSISATVIPR